MVVSERQNPIAIRREYLVSKFHTTDKIENMPKIKLPVTLTVKALIGSIPNVVGEDTILYLRKTPDKAPIDRNTNSTPSLFLSYHFNSPKSGRHYQHHYYL
jgi:hypothetical protein